MSDYWIYRTKVLTWRNQYVQARLMSPAPRALAERYKPYGFRSALQDEPYGAALQIVYQVDRRHPHPDNYFENTSFTLFSDRLVELMRSYNVLAEVFPIGIVDRRGQPLPELRYSVFHSLEGLQDAIDPTASGWTGDRDVGIRSIVLKEAGFERRPIFRCEHVYLPLMRDDLKQEIQRRRISGFVFLPLERYQSGTYGPVPEFED